MQAIIKYRDDLPLYRKHRRGQYSSLQRID